MTAQLIKQFVPRETPIVKPRATNWFPGHMPSGLKRMQMVTLAGFQSYLSSELVFYLYR